MTTKHTYEAIILADSISPAGHRLTTMEVTLPRFVLAEFNTHRQFSRNSASSRAIPVEKRIAAVREYPFVPESFGRNKAGMQATEYVSGTELETAREAWFQAAEDACQYALTLAQLGVHKQLANRLLEPFCWHTIICTATDWANFFAQRCHPDAQPEIRIAAELMRVAMEKSVSRQLNDGQWHLPLVDSTFGDPFEPEVTDIGTAGWAKISAARCARVSYLTHDGKRDLNADLILYDRLTTSGHMSPLEHPARPMTQEELHWFRTQTLDTGRDRPNPVDIGSYLGNLNGWISLRKTIPNERVFQPKAVM